MQKKILSILCLVCIWMGLSTVVVYGSEVPSQTQQNQVLQSQLDMLNWDEVKQIEERLKSEVPQLRDYNLSEKVISLMTGQERFSVEEVLRMVGEAFFGEIHTYIDIVVRFILIVLLCSLLQTLSTSFKSGNVTKAGFMVCYMLIIYTVMHSLFMIVNVASQTISQLCDMMMVAVPTLLGFMAISGYITSSTALAPVIVGGLNLIAFVVQKVILPLVVSVVILQIVSSMSEEIKVDKLVKLFYRGTKYVLRGIFWVSLSIMGIYKVTLPLMDVAMKKGALTFGTAFLPVIGDATNGALEFIMACAQMVKNSFAVGVIIWICILVAVPLIKIFAYIVLYHAAGALVQPIGEKKMTDIATNLAKGCEFVMSCVGIVSILCVVVMLICVSIGTNLT
ncbi:MAG: stage III sporulation protein AE [Cellulosilyticaceae bacterium]